MVRSVELCFHGLYHDGLYFRNYFSKSCNNIKYDCNLMKQGTKNIYSFPNINFYKILLKNFKSGVKKEMLIVQKPIVFSIPENFMIYTFFDGSVIPNFFANYR